MYARVDASRREKTILNSSRGNNEAAHHSRGEGKCLLVVTPDLGFEMEGAGQVGRRQWMGRGKKKEEKIESLGRACNSSTSIIMLRACRRRTCIASIELRRRLLFRGRCCCVICFLRTYYVELLFNIAGRPVVDY